MNKTIVYLSYVLGIIFLGSGHVHSQEIDKNKSWFNVMVEYQCQSDALLKGVEWLSFDMEREQHRLGDSLWTQNFHVVLHYGRKDAMVFVDDPDHFCWFRVTRKKAETIDYGENRIITYKKRLGGAYSDLGLHQNLSFYVDFLWYYMIPLPLLLESPSVFRLVDYEDRMVSDTPVRMYVGSGTSGMAKNDSTGKFDIPLKKEIFSYVNNSTNVLDSIHIHYIMGGKLHSERFIRISNLRYDNRQQYVDSIFDYTDPRYAKFSYHDEKTPARLSSRNKTINNEVSNFPLVSLTGDTITIAQTDGWLLLNFWSPNCSPCIEHLRAYQHEKDSLGYRILENESIRILAINHVSDNMELLRAFGKKTGTADIMYSAKDMHTLINIPYLGYYYLLSPDKEIVYETCDLGDYSELLKAKEDYEKTHANN